MDSICGSRDPMAVSIGLVAADATSLKEPRLSQMTQLVETFDSLAPLKEGLCAHVLAQAVRGAALPQCLASLPHGPKGIWVDLLRLHSNPESSESTSPPGASHSPSLSRSDHLLPASFLARMCSDAEESAITSPSAAMSSAPRCYEKAASAPQTLPATVRVTIFSAATGRGESEWCLFCSLWAGRIKDNQFRRNRLMHYGLQSIFARFLRAKN